MKNITLQKSFIKKNSHILIPNDSKINLYSYTLKDSIPIIENSHKSNTYNYKGMIVDTKTLNSLVANSKELTIFIGGEQKDMTSHLKGILFTEAEFNVSIISNSDDFQSSIDSSKLFSQITDEKNNHILNIIGAQRHLNTLSDSPNLYYYPWNQIRKEPKVIEIASRNSSGVLIDINVLSSTYAPGTKTPSINGMNPIEFISMCKQIVQNPNVKTIGFYNYDSNYDINQGTAKIIADALFYIKEGVDNRGLHNNTSDFTTYKVQDPSLPEPIKFRKNNVTQKWDTQINDCRWTPCREEDYLFAGNGNITDFLLFQIEKYGK